MVLELAGGDKKRKAGVSAEENRAGLCSERRFADTGQQEIWNEWQRRCGGEFGREHCI